MGTLWDFYQDELSGFTIAFTIRSVDRSLSTHLIPHYSFGRSFIIHSVNHSLFSLLILLLSQKPSMGLMGRDDKQNAGVGYSDAVEIRAHFSDKH